MHLPLGIYEQIVNLATQSGLRTLGPGKETELVPLDGEAAEPLLARYLNEALTKGLAYLNDKSGEDEVLRRQVAACNLLIELMAELTDEDNLLDWRIGPTRQLLLAVLDKQNRAPALTPARHQSLPRPATTLSISTLLTGSVHEPSMLSELKKEILTADKIDLLVSFIKWSGLRLIMEELQTFTRTKPLRVITTSYMGATDLKAIMELVQLPGTRIKVSYDTRSTRLHAKSYMFTRESGFSTAYIGSSNLSGAAIGGGLEWNVKVTAKDMPHVFHHLEATFETYWNDGDFQDFSAEDEPVLRVALGAERSRDLTSPLFFRITPYPFQQEILERLEAERNLHGNYRNLVVAATGTGKTVISAFDYQRFCRQNPKLPNRLLFVAHRREILQQSLQCFRTILRDNNFGTMLSGQDRPEALNHLFVSIQSFNSQDFTKLIAKDYYDYIVVDEFHHAAAPSYQELLTYCQPKVLLGLTATPERLDGQDIVSRYFGGRLAAEVRLPEAINRQLLAPFQYFGVSDAIDISKIRFERGRYDIAQLEKVYTGNDLRTDAILRALRRYVDDLDRVVGLGFCVSVAHAKYMAASFTSRGVPSMALHGDSAPEERETAKNRLTGGEVRFIFTVDLYNEGVDLPEVNTILFLRPTESLTVFLQQLGRGLRLCEGKELLTVLDFIGHAHRQYSFEAKFRVLLGHTARGVPREISDGFPSLPRGCHILLEAVAQATILANIRESLLTRANLIDKLRNFMADTGQQPTLSSFLRTFATLDLEDIYKRGTFTSLRSAATPGTQSHQLDEQTMRKAFLRLSRIDSRRWICFLRDCLRGGLPSILSEEELRMIRMFHYTAWQKVPSAMNLPSARQGLALVQQDKLLCAELGELLDYCYDRIDFVDKRVALSFVCPLDLHCTYSRDEILAAVGLWTDDVRPEVREGVKWLPEQRADLLFVNLHKDEKNFSPTTMYQDYAISETLFHWQTQSTTSAESPTAQRYFNHRGRGSQVLLFVREHKMLRNLAQPYTYLGKANYVSHTGSRPVSIIWRLEEPMPPSLLPAALKAGAI
ncbi:MAG: putative DNA repair helicase RadD [Firmicutes bacterium]|nr:putative DNA repair helicase RadD [Bacillota bacterium]